MLEPAQLLGVRLVGAVLAEQHDEWAEGRRYLVLDVLARSRISAVPDATTSSPSGQRHYPEGAVERVRFLQRLYAAGLSSRTIAELLPCVDSPSAANTDAAFHRMVEERDHLTTHIEELVNARDALDQLIEANRTYNDSQLVATESAPVRPGRRTA